MKLIKIKINTTQSKELEMKLKLNYVEMYRKGKCSNNDGEDVLKNSEESDDEDK